MSILWPILGPITEAPRLPDHQVTFQKDLLGEGRTRGPSTSEFQPNVESQEVEIESTAYEESSGEMDEGTEGSVTDKESSVQNLVEKYQSADSKRLSAHPEFKASATPSRTDFPSTKLMQPRESAEGNDKALQSAGETDDDEL
ncbi:hypothetical protein P170DRAFT_441547 [Aspergillus steynii IBT 23096]|uniref:Uncharacterized protein n=1 Tax=Aspergillus steynii IBT 23096 TaxID=1392250 RepID=A0A2I2FR34_9EURO|nr:uncharacterized protein P170DRAFT_441547 [Aspergillus steynii IBT 23096]PLB43093.1 hypothetical protein P170DRAFT_441547 [Aspergillus steynii IBT 23096]